MPPPPSEGGGVPPPPTAPQTVEHPSGSHIGWRPPPWFAHKSGCTDLCFASLFVVVSVLHLAQSQHSVFRVDKGTVTGSAPVEMTPGGRGAGQVIQRIPDGP